MTDADKLIQRSEFKRAERLLLDNLNAADLSDQTLAFSEQASYADAILATSELYLRSGQFSRSIEWAKRCEAHLPEFPAAAVDAVSLLDRAHILIARALTQSGQRQQAIDLLQQLLRQRADEENTLLSQLNMSAAIAELQLDAQPQAMRDIADSTRELAQRVERLTSKNLLDTDSQDRALKCAARVEASCGNINEALKFLRSLNTRSATDPSQINDSITFSLHIASLFREREAYADELKVLEEARRVGRPLHAESIKEENVQTTDDRAFLDASLTDQMGRCLLALGRITDGTRSLLAAYLAYSKLIERSSAEFDGNSGIAAERLESIRELVRDMPTSTSPLNGVNEFDVKRQLLNWYESNRLDDDPRTHQLRTSLATAYLLRGDALHAEELLGVAVPYLRKRVPRDTETLVRALVLFAETERSNGLLDNARQLLTEADECCQNASPSLRWFVRLHKACLHASVGEFRQATNELTSLRDDVGETVQVADEITNQIQADCLLNLALIDQARFRFDTALDMFEQATAIRRQFVGESDERLVPYLLANAAAYAATREVNELARVLEFLTPMTRDEATVNWQTTRHLQAMVHFLRDEANSNSRDRQEAIGIWSDLLADQDKAGAARTRHYLAATLYKEWSEQQQGWNAAGVSILTPHSSERAAYETELTAYRESKAEFEKSFKDFEDQKAKYSNRLKQYQDQQRRGGTPQTLDDYDDLSNEVMFLKDRQQMLFGERKLLKATSAKLKLKHAALLADSSSGLKKAREYAEGAVATLRELGVQPDLLCAALCNLAQILHAQAQVSSDKRQLLSDAIQRLSDAIVTIETIHLLTLSDEIPREEFVSRFRLPYELLIEWQLAAGNPREALIAAELLSNREFLLQLVRDDVYEKRELGGEERRLVEEFDQLVDRYYKTTVQVAAGISRKSGESQASNELSLEHLKQECAAAYSRIWKRSPIVDNTPGDARARSKIETAIETTFKNNDVVLLYHVGARSSHVFLVDGVNDNTDFSVELEFSADHSTKLGSQSVKASDIDNCVAEYLNVCRHPENSHELGESSQTRASLESLGNVLLPKRLRERIKDINPGTLTVIADGALRRLPLEALVVQAEPLRFLMDDDAFPALDYAPSLMTLDALQRRHSQPGPRRVLTVGDADFANIEGMKPLLKSQQECDNIVSAFDRLGPDCVVKITRAKATEEQFRDLAESDTHPFSHIHIATHGIVDTRGVLGYLALTSPPAPALSENNGRLEIHEISRMRLPSCELVALSACRTATSDDNSIDASNLGRTLAGAFLTSGARRVVASHWAVSDDASSEIMSRFFDEIAKTLEQNVSKINYATLLRKAISDYRTEASSIRNSPFFWAPYTMIGPTYER
ncbi:MAG: CHAT domain-containing protein [Planctomycetaceae bacterium]|nr:CHAT domain-containing protein [Planctomycetales bacterium]MCB9923058.1 CHAT domain-containing protein [Planctomycetaceae bacterium]